MKYLLSLDNNDLTPGYLFTGDSLSAPRC